MWQFLFNIVGSICFGFVTYCTYKAYLLSKNVQNNGTPTALESLKNSLLTFALLKLKQNDIDKWNMKYDSFNGSKLPMISGASLENACFSYILDIDRYKKSFLFTKNMEDKVIAIEKYLQNNFDTNEKVVNFFNEFVQLVIQPVEDENTTLL